MKLKLASVRAFNFVSSMTPKKKRFGIIEEVCQRIGNRSLGSGHLKGSTCIRKWIKEDVGMKHYQQQNGTEKNSKKERIIIPNSKSWNCFDCDSNCKWS